MARSRGVRGAASWCAIAAIFYLLVRFTVVCRCQCAAGPSSAGGQPQQAGGLFRCHHRAAAAVHRYRRHSHSAVVYAVSDPADLPGPAHHAACTLEPCVLSARVSGHCQRRQSGRCPADKSAGHRGIHQHPAQRRAGTSRPVPCTLRDARHRGRAVLPWGLAGPAAPLRQCGRHLRSGASVCPFASRSHPGA